MAQINLTVNITGNGTGSATITDSSLNALIITSVSPSTVWTADEGAFTLDATPDSNCAFGGWYINGELLSTDRSVSTGVTLTEDTTIDIKFVTIDTSSVTYLTHTFKLYRTAGDTHVRKSTDTYIDDIEIQIPRIAKSFSDYTDASYESTIFSGWRTPSVASNSVFSGYVDNFTRLTSMYSSNYFSDFFANIAYDTGAVSDRGYNFILVDETTGYYLAIDTASVSEYGQGFFYTDSDTLLSTGNRRAIFVRDQSVSTVCLNVFGFTGMYDGSPDEDMQIARIQAQGTGSGKRLKIESDNNGDITSNANITEWWKVVFAGSTTNIVNVVVEPDTVGSITATLQPNGYIYFDFSNIATDYDDQFKYWYVELPNGTTTTPNYNLDRDMIYEKTLSGIYTFHFVFADSEEDLNPYNEQDTSSTGGGSESTGGEGDYDRTSDVIDHDLYNIALNNDIWKTTTTIYLPTLAQFESFFGMLYGTTLKQRIANIATNIASLGAKVTDYVLNCYILPAEVTSKSTDDYTFNLGFYDNMVVDDSGSDWVSKISTTRYISIPLGSIDIPEYWGNALDYEADIQLFLPYIGYVNLDARTVMGKTINLVYHTDLLTGNCVAIVSVNGSAAYQFNGNMAFSIPVSQDNRLNQAIDNAGEAIKIIGSASLI